MLIKCPECELQVSDKASACPHCGYPLKKTSPVPIRRSRKRKRLPNGFGSITELKNPNLRNRFWARKTVGKDFYGRQILKPLKPQSLFHTYNEAYEALMEYNKNPYDLDDDITVAELYDRWTGYYFDKLANESSVRTIKSAWAYCSSVHSMRAKDLRARHIKGCIEEGYVIKETGKDAGKKVKPSANMKGRIKSMFNIMLDYALEYEIVEQNYSRNFKLDKDIVKEKERNKKDHIPFTDGEQKILWDNVDQVAFVDMIIIGIYTGWRPQELSTMRLEDVDLNEWTMTGGMKTDAGKDRVVPIHSKIKDLIKKRYDQAVKMGSEFLFNDPNGQQGTHLTYDKYRGRFAKAVKRLPMEINHRPHDTRSTFVTAAKSAKVDEYAIKRMVGHAINDITEKVYTHRDIEWLRDEIEKIQ